MFHDDNFFHQADSAFEFDSFEFDADDWSPEDTFSPWAESTDGIYGGGTEHLNQSTDFTCAVVSQQMILNDFGINVSEAQLVYDATSNGWLSDRGTSIDDMGQLLEHHGISTHINYDGDVPSLVNELAHGHKVIVPVNSGELWNGVSFWERLTGNHNTGPDHAIVVSGVDFSDPDNPLVVVNDPGSGAGDAQVYPLEHFLESWNDSNCTYLATDVAPVGLGSDPHFGVQFDQSTEMYMTEDYWLKVAGHFVGGMADGFLGLPVGTTADVFGESVWEALNGEERNQLFLNI